jgi:hypothetical protein
MNPLCLIIVGLVFQFVGPMWGWGTVLGLFFLASLDD